MARAELIENIDYYIDDQGRFVFTEHYHLKRGYCCNSGCRHCPYKDSRDAAKAPEDVAEIDPKED